MKQETLPHVEVVVLVRLADAWNRALELDLAGDDLTDFRQAIHAAQRIILAREGSRALERDMATGAPTRLSQNRRAK